MDDINNQINAMVLAGMAIQNKEDRKSLQEQIRKLEFKRTQIQQQRLARDVSD